MFLLTNGGNNGKKRLVMLVKRILRGNISLICKGSNKKETENKVTKGSKKFPTFQKELKINEIGNIDIKWLDDNMTYHVLMIYL